MLRVVNPFTELAIAQFREHKEAAIFIIPQEAQTAFESWRQTTLAQRGAVVRRAGELLRAHRADLARTATLEMGKPIKDAEAEVDKCALACDYFADHAAEYLKPQNIASDAKRSFVRFDPLGPILAIMPWNFPYWQVFRFVAPALMAGNVGVLKHAPNVPGCAVAIEKILIEAGAPKRVFSTMLVSDARADTLVRHEAFRGITLTGSARAGKIVAAVAGSQLKKTVLELGGSDAFIVLEDADLESTARNAAAARCINAGQSCIAAKRFIIVGDQRRVDQFTQAMASAMAKLKLGDPLDRTTDIGPLARQDLVKNLLKQVKGSIAKGAKVIIGGSRPKRRGFFFEPTVLANVVPGMPAFDEETFGPVAAVVAAATVNDAVALANRSSFGLGASIWTSDAERGEQLAGRIEAGCVFINGIVKSDPRLPFGGIKQSGYGRELSYFGMHEFMNIKTVWSR